MRSQLLLVCFFFSLSGFAQTNSKFNLQKVIVRLTGGRELKGELILASGDSLVMLDRNLPLAGCKISFRYRFTGLSSYGTVKAVNDTSILIVQSVYPFERTIIRDQIDRIRITSYPDLPNLKELQRVVFKVPSIASIRMHKKGAGGLGAILGGAAGGFLAYNLAYNSSNDGSFFGKTGEASLVGIVGVLTGAPIGAMVGTYGKTRSIKGQQQQFDLFVKKLYK